MENFITILLIVSGITVTILAKPSPHGFDDEGEISVPRSPKIQGPDVINQPYLKPTDVEDLRCDIEGSPTPTVLWLKDNQDISNDGQLYNITYDVTDGKAELKFTNTAKSDTKHVTGNFTCMAVNFLGKVQKMYIIQVEEKDVTTLSPASTPELSSDSSEITQSTSLSSDDSSTQVFNASSTTPSHLLRLRVQTDSNQKTNLLD